MSLEEWLAWDYEGKSEWVDGEVVVSPPPGWDHAETQVSVAAVLKRQLPNLRIGVEADLLLPRNRVRRPDVMAFDHRPEGARVVTEVPILTCEVLSPGNRNEDIVRKSAEYAAFGVGQYWLVDPEGRTIDVLANVGGTWEPLLRLTDADPVGSVTIGEHGTVELDLCEIVGMA
jgi:Uma2 family endonuclease